MPGGHLWRERQRAQQGEPDPPQRVGGVMGAKPRPRFAGHPRWPEAKRRVNDCERSETDIQVRASSPIPQGGCPAKRGAPKPGEARRWKERSDCKARKAQGERRPAAKRQVAPLGAERSEPVWPCS